MASELSKVRKRELSESYNLIKNFYIEFKVQPDKFNNLLNFRK
jgi:hypothetical protein